MLYLLAPHLEKFWGPFRLLRSHALLLAIGTLLAAFAVVLLLPKLWPLSPRDHGKAILGKDGMKSAGKPTGAGLWVSLVALPVIILFAPLKPWDLAAVFALYGAMLFGQMMPFSS